MNAVGEPNGTIGEDSIGGNRIGSKDSRGVYYFQDNTLYDSLDHNCIIDTTSLQFQCTPGITSNTTLRVNPTGNLVHDKSENWLACPERDGSYLIFSDAKVNPTGCETVTLRIGGYNCTALGRPSSSSASPTTATTPSATSPLPSTVCPADISSGSFQSPHLIVPTSPNDPDHSFGNSYIAYISPTNTTLFNFDVPPSYANLTCALLFQFPFGSDLDPSAGKYYFSGMEQEIGQHGGLEFALLSGIVNGSTTFTSTPPVATDYGQTEIIPGNNYTIAKFPCPAGEAVSYSVGSRGNVELYYFQNSAPSPIGLYMVPCGA